VTPLSIVIVTPLRRPVPHSIYFVYEIITRHPLLQKGTDPTAEGAFGGDLNEYFTTMVMTS
jgi:hypothetical protein